jgi:hypothetical protein
VFVARVLDLPLHTPTGEVRRVITNQREQTVYLGIAKYRGDMGGVQHHDRGAALTKPLQGRRAFHSFSPRAVYARLRRAMEKVG